MRIKKFLTAAFICTVVLAAGQAFADDADDELGDDDGQAWINNVPPMSYWGLRGLPRTASAEALGEGRLNFMVFGSYYKQEQDLTLGGTRTAGPNKGTMMGTFRVGGSWGVNSYADLFGSIPMFIASDGGKKTKNFGEFLGGAQFAMPIPEEIPFRLAGQFHVIYGLNHYDDSAKVTYNPDYNVIGKSYAGYEYGEVQENGLITLVLKAPMSLVAGNLRRAIKLHINPGFALIQKVDPLFLLAGGVEIDPTEWWTIGLESNWRTPVSDGNGFADPFWFTPSMTFRSPYYANGLFGMSFVIGADICLSAKNEVEQSGGGTTELTKPLEPWRLFGDLVFSFDLLASKRAEMIRQAKANAAEKARLRKQAELTAAQKDSIAAKAREDSLAQAAALAAKAEKARRDSIAQAEKARQDSIALTMSAAEREAQLKAEAEAREAQLKAQSAASEAQLKAEAEKKRVADSIALAELNKKLAEERAKRSAVEQQMLSTGMLVLDGVFFVTGKAEIQLNSRGYLTTLAKMLVKYPKLRIEIGGHTDNTGRLETNMTLSQSRADAVFMFMHNVEPGLAQMLSTKGYGPTVPKADNNTAAGREVNRRVELKVLNPEVLQEYNP